MAENITIFREAGQRYYSAIVDGRIIDSLGPDEMLAAVASLLLPSCPPYAKPKTIDEFREQERARATHDGVMFVDVAAFPRGLRIDAAGVMHILSVADIKIDRVSTQARIAELFNRYFTTGALPE
jgi:hypothetical protein